MNSGKTELRMYDTGLKVYFRASAIFARARFRFQHNTAFSAFGLPVPPASLISFDAFDTLVTRAVFRPSDIFLLTGYVLRNEGRSRLLPEEWHNIRSKAEAKARRNAGPREVTLEEIYQTASGFPMTLELDLPGAMATELALEKRLIRPIADNIAAINALAGTHDVAVLSDTYFDHATLVELLRTCGVDDSRLLIMASAETGETKQHGSMFSRLRKHKSNFAQYLHIGDNPVSDVLQARRAGYQVKPYLGGTPTKYELQLAQSDIKPAILRSILAGSARAARLQTPATGPHEQSIAAVSSGVSAILLVAFVVWLLNRAVASGVSRLYFLARDSEILLQIARRFIETFGLPIEASYLYVSRQSLHLPAIGIFTREDAERLGFVVGCTLADILSKLDISPSPALFEALASTGFSEHALQKPLSRLELDHLIIKLADPCVAPFITASVERNRALLLDYLRQENVLAPGKIGIVDIGWRGTLQHSLCQVVATTQAGFSDRLHGFYYGLYRWPKNIGTMEAYFSTPEAAAILPHVRGSLFEVFCAARHGTTRRYQRESNHLVTPVLASPDNAEAARWGLHIQQAAICHFTDNLIATSRVAGLDIRDAGAMLSKAASDVILAFILRPSSSEAQAIGSFPHAADQLHQSFTELAPVLPTNLREWRRRIRLRHVQPLISYWPEGSVIRSLPRPAGLALLYVTRHMRAARSEAASKRTEALSKPQIV